MRQQFSSNRCRSSFRSAFLLRLGFGQWRQNVSAGFRIISVFASMNIHFERSGGFAGLRLSHDLDSAELSPEDGKELERLVDTAHLFELPETIRAVNPGPDRFQYKLTMKAGPREHTVAVDEAAVPDSLRPLLNWLIEKVRKR
jgi:hypothetical protein